MIRVDFVLLVAGLIAGILGVFVVSWILLREKKSSHRPEDDVMSSRYLRQCPYCGHVFMDYTQKDIVTCQICSSLFDDKKEASNEDLE